MPDEFGFYTGEELLNGWAEMSQQAFAQLTVELQKKYPNLFFIRYFIPGWQEDGRWQIRYMNRTETFHDSFEQVLQALENQK